MDGDVQLFSVYVPTNHIYVGDVFLLGKQDIIKVNLSVREGLGEKLHSGMHHCIVASILSNVHCLDQLIAMTMSPCLHVSDSFTLIHGVSDTVKILCMVSRGR